jgi:hypothetical protein
MEGAHSGGTAFLNSRSPTGTPRSKRLPLSPVRTSRRIPRPSRVPLVRQSFFYHCRLPWPVLPRIRPSPVSSPTVVSLISRSIDNAHRHVGFRAPPHLTSVDTQVHLPRSPRTALPSRFLLFHDPATHQATVTGF